MASEVPDTFRFTLVIATWHIRLDRRPLPSGSSLSGPSTAHRCQERRYTGIRVGGTWTSLPIFKTAELPRHKYLVKHSSQWEPWQVDPVRKGHKGSGADF